MGPAYGPGPLRAERERGFDGRFLGVVRIQRERVGDFVRDQRDGVGRGELVGRGQWLGDVTALGIALEIYLGRLFVIQRGPIQLSTRRLEHRHGQRGEPVGSANEHHIWRSFCDDHRLGVVFPVQVERADPQSVQRL